MKISGKDGAVFAEKMTLKVTEEDLKYMAVPVFKKKITLNVPEGEYELRAEILEGAAAFDGRLTVEARTLDLGLETQIYSAAKTLYPDLQIEVHASAWQLSDRPMYLGKRHIVQE